MADVKISALPAATTPLAGTELVPIVQSGVTSRVSVDNLTAGKTVAASTVNVDANTASAAVRITQTGAGNALVVEDSANPDATPFVVNAAGYVVAGYTTPIQVLGDTATYYNPSITTAGVGTDNRPVAVTQWSSNLSRAPQLTFAKSASNTIGTFASVSNAAILGRLSFDGDDGTNFIRGAEIRGDVDGTPGTNDMPGRLVFSTTADGAGSPTERMRITNAGLTSLTGSFGRGAPVTKTGNFTLANTENWIICNGAGSITVTFPAAASWTGREVMIKTIAAQTVVSASSNVVPLAGGAAGTAILPASAGAWATLVSDGTNWIIMQS